MSDEVMPFHQDSLKVLCDEARVDHPLAVETVDIVVCLSGRLALGVAKCRSRFLLREGLFVRRRPVRPGGPCPRPQIPDVSDSLGGYAKLFGQAIRELASTAVAAVTTACKEDHDGLCLRDRAYTHVSVV